MVDKFRRRDDSDDSSSLEEGETRIGDRSKKIDRDIPRDRDSRRRGSDRRREYSSESDKEPPKSKHNHNGDHREIRDERDRDSSHKRSDSRIDDRDLPKADDEDLEEKVSKIMKKIDEKEKEKEKPRITDGDRYRGSSRRRRDSDSSESDEELEKMRRNRSGDRDRDSGHKRSDRRRDERDLPKSDDENLEENISNIKKKIDENEKAKEKEKPRITDGDRYRGSSRRRHDSDLSESDEELEKKRRNRSGDRDTNSSRRGDRRKHESDSSESDGELEKKQRHRSGDRDRDSSRRGDRRRHESDSSDSDGELEKKRHNRKGERDSSRRGDKKKHKSGPSESDEDLEKKRGIRNGDKEISNPPVKSSNFMRWHDDRRNKVSSEEEEKLKDRRNRSEVGERAGKDRHKRDRESEKKFERKRDERDGYERRDGREKEVRKAEDGNNFGNLESRNAPILSNNGASTNINTANSGRSGGVYIPPFKLAQMMKDVEDKSSVEYQRLTWDALRKSINGLVNKVNAANIKNIVTELFEENLIRGRGLFCRSCMKSQMASPGFTDVFSALVAVVNTKFPEVGELLLRRIVLQLKRAYKRNDKHQLLAAVKFIAHLVNQQVAHEIIALELLTVLLENPTDDSVEVAVGFVTECGSLLQDLSPQGLHGIFERFRGILHEGEIDKRVQFLIEGLFAIRKAKFQGHPAVRPELDLVDQEDQLTHELSLEDEIDPETTLDIFKPDETFVENEKRYEELVKNILGDESVKDEASSDDESLDDEEDEDSDEEEEEQMKIKDETETNLVNLRRTIYLTIMSSVDFEEAGHKLLKIKLEPGQEMELCIMLLECCSQERTYLRYYGLLGQRFCMINKIHQENFEKCFVQQYSMIHRLETNKLRNVAKFFAHLLGTDALPWHVLSYIRLTEEDTTSSSRIFIKILFQELSEHLGIRLLNERLTEPTMQDSFESIFPKDNPKNTRFSINFFTSIGLGGITENLREYLKNMPRLIMQQQVPDQDSDDSDSSPSSSRATSSSSESESEKEVKRKRRRRS